MVYGFDFKHKGVNKGCKGKYEYFAKIDGNFSGGNITAGSGENELRFFAVNHYCSIEDAIKYNKKFAKKRLDIHRKRKGDTTYVEDMPIVKTVIIKRRK
jgi:hypothetical protein